MTIDSHFHVWDATIREHGWLQGAPSLQKRSWFEEFKETSVGSGVEAGILVQVLNDFDGSVEFLAAASVEAAVAGVVAWVDLGGDVASQVAALEGGLGGELLVGGVALGAGRGGPALPGAPEGGGGRACIGATRAYLRSPGAITTTGGCSEVRASFGRAADSPRPRRQAADSPRPRRQAADRRWRCRKLGRRCQRCG